MLRQLVPLKSAANYKGTKILTLVFLEYSYFRLALDTQLLLEWHLLVLVCYTLTRPLMNNTIITGGAHSLIVELCRKLLPMIPC